MRWPTNFYDFRFKSIATAGIRIHPTKAWLSQLVNFKNAIWTLEELYAIKFCFKLGKMPCNESWICCYDPEIKRQSSQWMHVGSPRPKKASQSKSTQKLLMIPFFDSTCMIYLHWVPTGQTVNKEYYVEVLREFRKRFPRKRPALFKSGLWHFHQDNAPVHNCILVTDYLTKIGIKAVRYPPYSLDLAPCDFCLFPKLRGCRFETIEMKEAVTKVIDTLTREDLYGALKKLLQRYKKFVSAGRRLVRRGLEFHVCTINKSAHTKKVWKLI